MGEKTTWKIICEDGSWVGRSLNCGMFPILLKFLLSDCLMGHVMAHLVEALHYKPEGRRFDSQ